MRVFNIRCKGLGVEKRGRCPILKRKYVNVVAENWGAAASFGVIIRFGRGAIAGEMRGEWVKAKNRVW